MNRILFKIKVLWNKWILGRTYAIGIDYGMSDGDYTAITTGYKDRKGILHITKIDTGRASDE